MAAILPLSDRRARMAFVLAVLGLPSMGVTVPAAVWLGVRAVRQERLSSGGEPALGFIALVVAVLDVLTINPVVVRIFELVEPQRAWAGLATGIALAVGVFAFTASVLRIHPERWGAVFVARAGLIAVTAGGAVLFVRILTLID
jgi:hypothetical protein